MGLTLNDLKQVLQPLTGLGKGEASFEVEREGQSPLRIVLRTLTPEEELLVQRYARGALTEGDANDQMNAMDYLDRFRASCLGYAIIQVGDVDLRNVDTVETGEKLPNGVAVRIKRHEAVKQIVETWSRVMTTAVFQRYNSLNEQMESLVDRAMKYDDDFIDSEIARLEERLTELKNAKSKKTAGESDLRDSAREVAANKTPTENGQASATEGQPKPKDEPKPTWEEVSRSGRTTDEEPVFVATPPDVPRTLATEDQKPAEPAPSGARQPVFGNRPPARPVQAAPSQEPTPSGRASQEDPLSDVRSSFVDVEDKDAIEEENRRLLEERRKRAMPMPPHMAAREVAQGLDATPSPGIQPAGNLGGVPVFQRPVETLTPDMNPPQAKPPAKPAPSNVNPKFKPAK